MERERGEREQWGNSKSGEFKSVNRLGTFWPLPARTIRRESREVGVSRVEGHKILFMAFVACKYYLLHDTRGGRDSRGRQTQAETGLVTCGLC